MYAIRSYYEERVTQRGDLLQLERSAHRDRMLAARNQRDHAPQLAWLPAAGAGELLALPSYARAAAGGAVK